MTEITVKSSKKIQAIDITSEVEKIAREKAGKENGVVHIFVPHCTVAIFVNEFEPKICEDYEKLATLLQMEKWKHDNADNKTYAHLANVIFGSSACIPVENGKLILGTWQKVILMELDGPKTRKVICNFTSTL